MSPTLEAMATANAMVLPESAAGSSAPQTIAGLPGRWTPGQPYLPSALGMTEDEARALLASVVNPIEWVEVTVEDGDANTAFDPYPSQVASGFQDVEASRLAEAEADGEVVSDHPAWVVEHLQRSTDLAQGVDPDQAALERAAAAEREGLTVPQLRERATELGVDPAGMKKADLQAAVAEAEEARIAAGDAIEAGGVSGE